MSKNNNFDEYKYSGYGIGFNAPRHFLLSDDFGLGNVIIFGTGMSLSVHIDNKNKYVFILVVLNKRFT